MHDDLQKKNLIVAHSLEENGLEEIKMRLSNSWTRVF